MKLHKKKSDNAEKHCWVTSDLVVDSDSSLACCFHFHVVVALFTVYIMPEAVFQTTFVVEYKIIEGEADNFRYRYFDFTKVLRNFILPVIKIGFILFLKVSNIELQNKLILLLWTALAKSALQLHVEMRRGCQQNGYWGLTTVVPF